MARTLGEITYIASDLGPFRPERVDGFTYADREEIGHTAGICLERAWCQTQVRLHLQPGDRLRPTSENGPTLRERSLSWWHPQYPHNPQRRGSAPAPPPPKRRRRRLGLPAYRDIPNNISPVSGSLDQLHS